MRFDRDLGPFAGFTGNLLDFDDAVVYLGDFELKQFGEEFGVRARNDNNRVACVLPDLLDDGAKICSLFGRRSSLRLWLIRISLRRIW